METGCLGWPGAISSKSLFILSSTLKMNHNTNNPNDGTVKVAVEFDLPVSELEQLSTRSHQQSHLASQPTQPGTGRSEILSSYGGQRGEDVPRGGNLEGQECVVVWYIRGKVELTSFAQVRRRQFVPGSLVCRRSASA